MGGIRSYVDYSKVVLDEPTERYLATKKKSTAETYRGNLKRLQKYLDKPLGQWITEIEEQQKENEDLPLVERKRPGENDIRGFIEWMKENGYGNNPIRNSLTATQNMFKYYSIKMSFAFIEIPPPIRRKGNSKQEWTLNKLKKFVEAASTYRDKAIIVVMLQTGMAVNEISNLNYGDVKRQLENDELPVLIKLVREKNSNSFKTLMGADAVKYLRLYLDTRGKLSDNDPLFTKWGTEDRITDGSIANRFREIVKDLDFIEIKRGKMNPARPHSLRAAFKSRLTGKTDTDLIKFWMGNVLGPKSTAYLNLPDEEHVKLYMSIEKYISIETTAKEVLKGRAEATSQAEGLTQETIMRISRLEQENQTLRRWVEEMAERLGSLEALKERVEELEDYVEMGVLRKEAERVAGARASEASVGTT